MTEAAPPAASPERRPDGKASWLRRYPPMATFAIVLLIMLVIMPSALNLPQANPSTVLEYAPVPPEDEDPPPQSEGSLSSLGLGSSSTLDSGSKLPDAAAEDLDGGGKGKVPVTKNCVGNPPRQTEDPNSPPCVPFFEGDNGGETWQGVSGDEINVLVYTSTSLSSGDDDPPEDSPDAGTYCDVDAKPNSNPDCLDQAGTLRDHSTIRQVRALSKFFNGRFQTYGRHIHFYVYYSSGFQTPSGRRSDAHDNWETVKPFAVIDDAFFGGFNDVYSDAMARRKVVVFSNFSALANKVYRDNQPYLWTFWPDVEHWADLYGSYLCTKVVPFTVKHTGNSADEGKKRRYGLLSTNNDGFPGLQLFARYIEERLRKGCPNGHKADIAGEWFFPNAQYSVDSDPAAVAAARSNVAEMEAAGVTTVLFLGGTEGEHSKAMDEARWYPEIVVAGDLTNDLSDPATFQNQRAWANAWLMTNQLREDKREDVPCKNAFREGDPFGSNDDESRSCDLYRSFFMMFRSIQVAGPFLTPDAVDQGNHKVPRLPSDNPYTAACFFDPGDYSCVKDAHEEWWDPDAPSPDGDPGEQGCWRMVNEARRYLANEWEGTDEDVFKSRKDACNNVEGTVLINATGGL